MNILKEKQDIEELLKMLEGRPPEFKQKVLDTIKGMTLMLDHYKKTG